MQLMEPDGSLPHAQQPSTCPYPEPNNSVHGTPSYKGYPESKEILRIMGM
jgi:hypothetical protein